MANTLHWKRSSPSIVRACVYAAQDQDKRIAIVAPNEPALKQITNDNGTQGSGLEDLCHGKKVNDSVLKEMQAAGKKGGLAGFKMIEDVELADVEWVPQNGLMSSVQKPNRKGLPDKYKEAVNKACGK